MVGQEGGLRGREYMYVCVYIYTFIADSHYCTEETKTIIRSKNVFKR